MGSSECWWHVILFLGWEAIYKGCRMNRSCLPWLPPAWSQWHWSQLSRLVAWGEQQTPYLACIGMGRRHHRAKRLLFKRYSLDIAGRKSRHSNKFPCRSRSRNDAKHYEDCETGPKPRSCFVAVEYNSQLSWYSMLRGKNCNLHEHTRKSKLTVLLPGYALTVLQYHGTAAGQRWHLYSGRLSTNQRQFHKHDKPTVARKNTIHEYTMGT